MDDMNRIENDAWKNFAIDEDKNVFVDYNAPGMKTRETLYGDSVLREGPAIYRATDRIKHLGFNTIGDFDIAILNLKKEIKDYFSLLNEYQERIDQIDVILQQKDPKNDVVGAIPKLKEELELKLETGKLINEAIIKEQKNLKELEAAREEFRKNKRGTYKPEAKERIKLLKELGEREEELKKLKLKMDFGTISNLEKERKEILENEIIPKLNKMIEKRDYTMEKARIDIPFDKEAFMNNLDFAKAKKAEREAAVKVEDNVEGKELDEGDEIVNEEDGSHLTNDSKFKNVFKKVVKLGKVLGGIALIGGIAATIYMLTKGDTEPFVNMVQGVSDALQHSADTAQETLNNVLNSSTVDGVSQVYDSSYEAVNSVNPETPLEPWFQNEVVGYVDNSGNLVDANTIGEGINNNAVSYALGDENGIDGFVSADQVYGGMVR